MLVNKNGLLLPKPKPKILACSVAVLGTYKVFVVMMT